ncbi:MAG TPA: hypothetical protein VK782_05610, partial [Candidatus Sulfotelmatobacter sp.]|nr:hypothetical protein [Candidatus Sulfotelmatobacter sp.]
GWCPIALNPEQLKRRVDELKRECTAVGRNFAELDITIMGGIRGDRAKVQEGLQEFAEAGAGRFVAGLGDLTFENTADTLKKLAALYV